MEKIVNFSKMSRTKNKRIMFVILGEEGLYKIPDMYNLVVHEKSLPVTWFSRDLADLKKKYFVLPYLKKGTFLKLKLILRIKENASRILRKIGWQINENDGISERDEGNSGPQVTYVSFSDIQSTPLPSSYFAVVQNMKKIRPSDLVSIMESVVGKGSLVFIFSEVKDINKFTSPKACDLLKSRFMKRLFAAFTSCPDCLILDDNLNVLFGPKSGYNNTIQETNLHVQSNILQVEDEHSEIFDKLIRMCITGDQSRFLSECLNTLKRRSIHCTISASSPRGRGKSVVLGLAIAGAIALKYSNIFISSLSCDNVKIIFKYLLMGLDAIQFKEGEDYDLIQSINPKFNNALLGLNIFRDHPQAVRFIFPADVENKLEQAELVVINEAAAMPLPLLKKLLGPYIVLMASTTEGCGASGKHLYTNMISEIRHFSSFKNSDKSVSLESLFPTSETSCWKQIILSEPVNYSSEDEVEFWINHTLCLDYCISPAQGCPDPQSCNLFYVCCETLFSYEPYAEKLLHQLMSLFFCTKRTVLPEIFQKIADDSNYHIFCLLPPYDNSKKASSDILCAILVHTEKHVPCNIVYSAINQSGDLQECFNKWSSTERDVEDFLPVKGIHIVDIVTYPCYRKMGYGSRALQLMQDFYENKLIPLDDKPYIYSCKSKKTVISDSQSWPPLLLQLSEVEADKVDYILVSYSLTADLLRFWKKVEFVPVYISAEKNSAQEHLCLMMKSINIEFSTYMKECWRSFREYYFIHLSSYSKSFPSELALNLLSSKFSKVLPKEALKKEDIDVYLKPQRMKALEKYCQNLGDLHCIMPCIPILAKLFFSHRFIGVDMPVAQQVILLAFGVQHKTIEDISANLSLHTTQVHGLLNRTIRRLTTYLTSIIEKAVEKTIAVCDVTMEPVSQSLDDELEEAAQKIKEKQKEGLKKLKEMDFSEYAIKGSEDDWEKALHSGRKTLVSIKSLKKVPEDVELPSRKKNKTFQHKKKEIKRKK